MSDATLTRAFAERLAEELTRERDARIEVSDIAEANALASVRRAVLKAATSPAPPAAPEGEWPEAVSDGLTLPCHDCRQMPRFDYRVADEFWRRHVPGPERTSVVCLPCLDRRCGGVGLADAIIEIQWTGTGHTVVCKPWLRHKYRQRAQSGEG